MYLQLFWVIYVICSCTTCSTCPLSLPWLSLSKETVVISICLKIKKFVKNLVLCCQNASDVSIMLGDASDGHGVA